jgi:hypothetical protein
VFGLASGIAHGVTLAWEYSHASRGHTKLGVWHDSAMSAIRGAGFAIGTGYLYGWRFGVTFGPISAVSQVIAYQIGIRPTIDYKPANRPRFSRRPLLAALNRTVGYAATGYISAVVANQKSTAMSVGLKAGLAIGLVTAVSSAFTPYIEWFAEEVPEKRTGVFGVALILVGFALQSVQYWLSLLDVKLT